MLLLQWNVIYQWDTSLYIGDYLNDLVETLWSIMNDCIVVLWKFGCINEFVVSCKWVGEKVVNRWNFHFGYCDNFCMTGYVIVIYLFYVIFHHLKLLTDVKLYLLIFIWLTLHVIECSKIDFCINDF